MSPSPQFRSAADWLSSAPKASNQPNSVKLEIYGLYKYLTVSPRPKPGSRPGMFDWTGGAKWDAWDNSGKTYETRAEAAEARYIEIAQSLGWTGKDAESPKEGPADLDDAAYYDDVDEIPPRKKDKGKSVAGGSGLGVSVSTMNMPSPDDEKDEEDSIHAYALSGDTAQLSLLLDKGADIDSTDEFGYSALHLACDRGQTESVKLLLSRGANAGLKDSDGHSPLSLARIAEQYEIVRLVETHLAAQGGIGQGA